MPKIKNLANGPVSVYCGGISMAVPPGEFLESDGFTEGELKFYRAHPDQFEVIGDAVEGSGIDAEEFRHLSQFKAGVGPIANRLGIGDSAAFTATVTEALDAGDKAKATLAEIVALFASDDVNADNVKDAVAKLIQDVKFASTLNSDGETTVVVETDSTKLDLAAAIALLDDANDEHWTQAGLPDISTLKTLTGGDVTRAQVDQLPEGDKRVRKV